MQCTSARPSPDFKVSARSPKLKKRGRGRAFSVWLKPEEEAHLRALAAGSPIGTFVKSKALQDEHARHLSGKYGAVEDKKALAQALSLLGQSRLASNLNQIAKAANLGTLPLTPEVEADVGEACEYIADIRALLIKALGLRRAK